MTSVQQDLRQAKTREEPAMKGAPSSFARSTILIDRQTAMIGT